MAELFKSNGKFRLYMMYQTFSGLGGGVFSVFMLLSVHMLYGNPMYTGIAGFLMTVPFVFSLVVGPIVDRSNKVKIMRYTTFLEFAVLALLAFTPLLEILGVLFMFAVVFIYSLAALFESPAGRALLPFIVEEDEILQANSLINIAALVGGVGIAFILFSSVEEGMNLRFVYGISTAFLAIAFAFTCLLRDPSVKEVTADAPKHHFMSDLIAGMKFVRGSVFFYILTALVSMRVVMEITATNMPAFAEYHVGVRGYIIFTIVGLAGGIVASGIIGRVGSKFKIGYLIAAFLVLRGIARVAFVYVLPAHYDGGLAILLMFAALSSCVGILYTTLEQRLPPKSMVGRVDTLTTTCFSLMGALGALLGGIVGRLVTNIDNIFIFQGYMYVVVGVLIILIPAVRKIPKMDDIERGAEE